MSFLYVSKSLVAALILAMSLKFSDYNLCWSVYSMYTSQMGEIQWGWNAQMVYMSSTSAADTPRLRVPEMDPLLVVRLPVAAYVSLVMDWSLLLTPGGTVVLNASKQLSRVTPTSIVVPPAIVQPFSLTLIRERKILKGEGVIYC